MGILMPIFCGNRHGFQGDKKTIYAIYIYYISFDDGYDYFSATGYQLSDLSRLVVLFD